MFCLGFEPGEAEWKVQMNPLSYGCTPYQFYCCLLSVAKSKIVLITYAINIGCLWQCLTKNKYNSLNSNSFLAINGKSHLQYFNIFIQTLITFLRLSMLLFKLWSCHCFIFFPSRLSKLWSCLFYFLSLLSQLYITFKFVKSNRSCALRRTPIRKSCVTRTCGFESH